MTNLPLTSTRSKNQGQSSRQRVVVVDGLNCFLRHFAVNESVTVSGTPCGGVVGFIRFLNGYLEQWAPTKMIVVWEQGGGSPRRKALLPEYKANRTKLKDFQNVSKAPDSLPSKKWIMQDQEVKLQQLLLLSELLKHLPVCQVYTSDTECDDVVAYLAVERFKENTDLTIVSTDKDFYQLLNNPWIRIWDVARKRMIDAKYVTEVFGVTPNNFCLAKAMVGDTSDNIPGIPGVGFKTVAKRFGSVLNDPDNTAGLKDLVSLCELASSHKNMKKVLESSDVVERNLKLMRLDDFSLNLPLGVVNKIDFQLDNWEPNLDKLGLIKAMLNKGVVTTVDFDRLNRNFKILLSNLS